MDDIEVILAGLNVPTVRASTRFFQWLTTRYPGWSFAASFCKAIPDEWISVEKGGLSLCYLASERNIMEIADRTPNAHLLPIGALMDGSFLVIDTLATSEMMVGSVNQIKAMAGEVEELWGESFHAFDMSYTAWLTHIDNHPADLRFL